MSSHNDGSIELLTGKTPAKEDPTSTAKSDHPDFGMIASRLRGAPASGLPAYVGIPRVPFMVQPTYLGMAHSGFAAGNPAVPGFKPPNLALDAGIDGARLGDRRHLVGQLDRLRRAARSARRCRRRPISFVIRRFKCSLAPRWPTPLL